MAQFVKKLQSSVRTVNLMMLLVLVNPIIKMVQAMNQLAAGNFTVRLAPAARGYEPNEIREFKAAFNWMKICRKRNSANILKSFATKASAWHNFLAVCSC